MNSHWIKKFKAQTARTVLLLVAGLVAPVLSAEDAFFETGSVVVNDSIDRGNWETVSLRETYTSPVVIVGPVSHNNDNSLSARVRNVTATSFEVGFQSPCESAARSAGGGACPSGGSWNSETIRYWVVEEGAWEFPDGTLIEAGRLNTSTVRSGQGSANAADTVVFQRAFSSPPAVLHSVNSFGDPDWITSTSFASGNNTGSVPSATDMSLALEGAEVTTSHGAETIGWVAIESGSGTNSGNDYVAGAVGQVVDRHSDACQRLGLGFNFASAPDVVASNITVAGTNGSWVRYCGAEIASNSIDVHVDEDQVNDAERTGLEEAVGVFAFSANGSGRLTRPDTFCTGISALFCDDFDVGTLASDGWSIDSFGGGNAGIGNQTSNSGNQSLFTFSGGVNVISRAFDLSDSTSGSLEYWWRRGADSFSENPEGGENLLSQYLNDSGQWQDIEILPGNGTPGESGTTQFELPSDAFHAGFRFRFRQSGGNNGNFDFWHVDDVVLRTTSFICEPDDFGRSALGPDWVTTRSRGNFSPQIVNGRLRMTQASGNQATAATYQRVFPGADNFIQIEFDYYAYGGSGADGLAVVFSDAEVTPQAGGYGGSLGYAQEPDGTGGFAGGWLGIGLDEYGNFSNDSEGRVGGNNGRTLDSVAVRGALPDYEYIVDSGGLSPGIDANNDNNPFRYRITIDSRNNQTPVLTVERNGRGTGNRFELLVQETLTNQPAIPENLYLSLTGSTGGSTNIHELDNLQVCADKVGAVQRQVDHFEIEHSGSSLTCRPETVTIRACDNADCSQTFNDPVDVTLSPSSGWLGGNTFTMTGGTATRTLRVTTLSTVTLGVPNSSPSTKPFARTLCSDGSPGNVSASKCDLTFYDAGFDISVPNHVSDTGQTATIAAVRKDDTSEQCVPGFDNETKSVSLWSGYTNPSTGTLPLFADGSALPGSSGPTRSLTFDANGEATVEIRYADVGRIGLNARYEGSGDDAGLVMIGNSEFVARPDHFNLTIPGNPAATAVAADNDFVAAGADFEINVAAVNASGNVTPNFGKESPNEGVSLLAELVAPVGGAIPPLVGLFGTFGEDCNGSAGAGGTACGEFSWPEVGIIKLTPSLASGSYMGTADVDGNAVEHVGRFIPARFDVSKFDGEVSPYCSVSTPFAYSGKSLGWRTGLAPTFQIDAVNVDGLVTTNYTLGSFQRLAAGDIGRTADNTDLVTVNAAGDLYPVQTALDAGGLDIVDRGRLQYRFAATDSITYEKTVDSIVRPFTPSYEIKLTLLEDADGVTSPQLPLAVTPVFGFDIRYGRLELTNAYGPETSDIVVPFEVQYFSSAMDGFVRNQADSCWTYNTSTDVSLDQSGLSGGSTSVDGVSDTLAAGRPKPGSELVLTAPGEPNSGDVLATFVVPIWLQDDFNGDGSLEDPSALATFGVYRGHDRVIYWQEK